MKKKKKVKRHALMVYTERDYANNWLQIPILWFHIARLLTSFTPSLVARDTVPGHWQWKCKGAGLKGIHKTGLWIHQSRGQCKCNHITLWKNKQTWEVWLRKQGMWTIYNRVSAGNLPHRKHLDLIYAKLLQTESQSCLPGTQKMWAHTVWQ